MKILLSSILSILILASCHIDKTKSGELPEVDLAVDAGELPKFDVDWAKVKMDTRTKTIKVPKVMVVMEEEEVEVPYLNVNMPDGDQDMEERTIMVEAEIDGHMHELDIRKVYAMNNKIVVVSELEKTNKSLHGKKVRISDQIVFNAPEDLVIKHYIVGDRPNGNFNVNYKYIRDEDDLKDITEGASVIYKS